MKIYLSGPMTGFDKFNYPLFDRIAKELREAGYDIINPSENRAAEDWQTSMIGSLRLLLHCRGIYMMQGWTDSKGASLEHEVAKELGYQVIYQP